MDCYPRSEHRDLGLGFLFFAQSYTDPDNGKSYEWETFVPVSGYCFGCNVSHLYGDLPKTRVAQKPGQKRMYGFARTDQTNLQPNDAQMTDASAASSAQEYHISQQTFLAPDLDNQPFSSSEHTPGHWQAQPVNFKNLVSPLVWAETKHAGPSYSVPDYEEHDFELRRVAYVRHVLNLWAGKDMRGG